MDATGGITPVMPMGGDGVGECTCVVHADFLVPSFFARSMFSLEWVKARERQ